MFEQGKEGAGSVGRVVLDGAGDERGVKSVEGVWSVWAVRCGGGGQHWSDSAGAGGVDGVSCGQGVQHKLLRSKTGAEAIYAVPLAHTKHRALHLHPQNRSSAALHAHVVRPKRDRKSVV